MKLRISIFMFLTVCFIFPCCKYKDGPIISLRTADRRLQGEFQAEAFEVDGKDAMNICSDSIFNNIIRMTSDDVGFKFHLSLEADFGGCFGTYHLLDNDETLEFNILSQSDHYPGYGPFRVYKISSWKILKLSNKKLWIETTFEGHDYYLKLKKTKDLPYNY
jgi:hypothetical protein